MSTSSEKIENQVDMCHNQLKQPDDIIKPSKSEPSWRQYHKKNGKELTTLFGALMLFIGLRLFYQFIDLVEMNQRNSCSKSLEEPAYKLLMFSKVCRNSSFRVIWNIPTEECLTKYRVDLNLSAYGIEVNNGAGWVGNIISLLYAPGSFPSVDPRSHHLINGGVPQAGNLALHEAKLSHAIETHIADKNFSGLGVIDFESWKPMFDQNFDSLKEYQDLSTSLVKQEHPTWSPDKIKQEAALEFNTAAKLFFTSTLNISKSMRPDGLWGFYNFPKCQSTGSSTACRAGLARDNEKLQWLFQASSVLFPSIYLHDKQEDKLTKLNKAVGEIQEAMKMRKVVKSMAPVLPYTKITYSSSSQDSWYSLDDLTVTIGAAHRLGVEGVVIWGDHYRSVSRSACLNTRQYVGHTLGPYLLSLTA